jgi:hypothetical protein
MDMNPTHLSNLLNVISDNATLQRALGLAICAEISIYYHLGRLSNVSLGIEQFFLVEWRGSMQEELEGCILPT